MAWFPWFRRKTVDPKLLKQQAALDADLAAIAVRRDIEAKTRKIAELREEEAYHFGSPAIRSRIEARREARRGPKYRPQQTQTKARLLAALEGEGLALCTAAVQSERPGTSPAAVRTRIGESLTAGFGLTAPFDFDFLMGTFQSIYQVQGLIREMWPYKPTILRTLSALDFARWCCRVIFEECPTAKGLVKGKTNFVIRRGLKASVVRRDKKVQESEAQKKAQWFVDRFVEENDYHEKETERCRRRMIEGEAFEWIADPRKPSKETATGEGACEVAFIEPDYIRPSVLRSEGAEDPRVGGGGGSGQDWSFGILTAPHRYYLPLKFNVVWNDNDEQVIDAKRMVHAAERERSNIKRCLPPLLSVSDDLIRLTILRSALADASKFRAAIGGIIKYEEASEESIATGDNIYGRSLDGSSEDPDWNVREVKLAAYANLIELPPGRDFIFPPAATDAAALTLIYDWHLQAVAQQSQVPEWLVKGASAGASFADSLTAESPSVVEFESEQARECRFSRRAIKRELQYRVEVGHLPANFWDEFDLDVQSDSVITRDSKAETETAKIQVESQLNSLRGARAQLGLDPDVVEKQIAVEKAAKTGPVWDETAREGKGDQTEEGGAQTTDGKRQELQGEQIGESFDPNQPRDTEGKWAAVNARAEKAASEAHAQGTPRAHSRARVAYRKAMMAALDRGDKTAAEHSAARSEHHRHEQAQAEAIGPKTAEGYRFTGYHASPERIEQFRDSRIGKGEENRWGPGAYFSFGRGSVSSFGENTHKVEIHARNPYFVHGHHELAAANLDTINAAAKELGRAGVPDRHRSTDAARVYEHLVRENNQDGNGKQIANEILAKAGYDSIFEHASEINVFRPETATKVQSINGRPVGRGQVAESESFDPNQPRDTEGKWAAVNARAEKAASEASGAGDEEDDEPAKRPAVAKGEAQPAKREGKGKDAKVVLADGSEAPSHITPGMIPPAWENVQVFTDPESEVWVKATIKGKNGKVSNKSVYKPSYEAEMARAKFARVNVMQAEIGEIDAKIQADRADPKLKDAADVAFLMREQATRPGSEVDTKGLTKHYGQAMRAENVVVTPAKGNGAAKVALKFGETTIPIKDAGTAAEIQRRIKSGQSLEDSTFWLKSHGATTLEGRHVVETKEGVRLQFVGKEGVWHDHLVENQELAKMLVERKNYLQKHQSGKLFGANDAKAAAYVGTLDHGRISPKDLRTNRANEIAAAEAKKFSGPPADEKEAKARKMQVATTVSRKLGNKPQQCIESYIDPTLWTNSVFEGAA